LLLTVVDEVSVLQEVRCTIVKYEKRRGGYDEFEVAVDNRTETQWFSFRANNDQNTPMSLADADGQNSRVVQTYSITERLIPTNEDGLDVDFGVIVDNLGERQRDAVLEGHRQRPCYMSINN
jgi:hypothetical protein